MITERVKKHWEFLGTINRPAKKPTFGEITPEEKKKVDDFVGECKKKGMTLRAIKRLVLRKFRVKII